MTNDKWQMANGRKFQTFVFCLLSFVFFLSLHEFFTNTSYVGFIL